MDQSVCSFNLKEMKHPVRKQRLGNNPYLFDYHLINQLPKDNIKLNNSLYSTHQLYQQQFTQLTKQSMQLRKRVSQLQNQLSNKDQQITNYVDQINNYLQQTSNYTQQITTYTQQITTYSQQITSYSQQINMLKCLLRQKEQVIQFSNQQIETLTSQLQSLHQQIQTLTTNLIEEKNQNLILTQFKNQIEQEQLRRQIEQEQLKKQIQQQQINQIQEQQVEGNLLYQTQIANLSVVQQKEGRLMIYPNQHYSTQSIHQHQQKEQSHNIFMDRSHNDANVIHVPISNNSQSNKESIQRTQSKIYSPRVKFSYTPSKYNQSNLTVIVPHANNPFPTYNPLANSSPKVNRVKSLQSFFSQPEHLKKFMSPINSGFSPVAHPQYQTYRLNNTHIIYQLPITPQYNNITK